MRKNLIFKPLDTFEKLYCCHPERSAVPEAGEKDLVKTHKIKIFRFAQ